MAYKDLEKKREYARSPKQRAYQHEYERRPQRQARRKTEQYRLWMKEYMRKRKYGLTPDDIKTLWEKQSGKCPVCKMSLPEKDFQVDHSHATGRVRGLLHRACNTLLGLSHDNITVLQGAIDFLRKELN